MRVAVIVNRYPVRSQTFVQTHFEGLLSAGVECYLVDKSVDSRFPRRRQPVIPNVNRQTVLFRATYKPELTVRAALAVLQDPESAQRNVRASLAFRGTATGSHWRLHGRLARLNPDVIHYSFAAYAIGEEHLGSALGVPLIVSFRGFDLTHEGLDDSTYYDRLWRAVDFVHFRSADLLRLAIERGFSKAIPHAITPPGIDADLFSPEQTRKRAHESEDSFVILSVGRLVPKKGHEVGLEVIRELQKRGIETEYRIVGEGEREESLRRTARELGVSDRVHLLGPLSPMGVRDELARANLLLHPSWAEGFGVSVLEAQAMQLPVVCSDAEGLSENVLDGHTGYVVGRGDVIGMANRTEEILRDKALAKAMGEAGRERVRERFTIGAEVKSYLDSYERVCLNPDGSP